ncbi:Aldehyde oxidase and xanthine dehydrogenase, middle chain [Candidatus Sulfopaludibacter sp. SbA6]|nr:Aldehyde oxidase and xanthine dehydrogenase, middle chain [Candidatus Sulfopaludibacter sp. SbA6]
MFEKVEAFYRPGNIREALRLLRSGDGRARIVAGGTDVVVEADRSIRFLIDITQAGLSYIRQKGNACHIGATSTMAALESSPVVRSLAGGILAQASATCGSVQIRNMSTLGGNLANASPAAETATALLALDAQLVLAYERVRRKVPLTAIYSKLRETLLHDALIVEIVIPAPPRGGRWCFHKLGRTAIDLSLVNLAAGLQLDSKDRVKWARIALGAVAPTPIRAVNAERLLVGHTLDEALLEEVSDEVAREVTPITDVRASAEYRRTMSRVLARRALEECTARSGCVL